MDVLIARVPARAKGKPADRHGDSCAKQKVSGASAAGH